MVNRVLLTALLLFFGIAVLFGQSAKGDFNLYVQAAPYPTYEFQDFGLIAIAGAEYFVSQKVSIGTSFFTSNNTLFKGDRGPTIRSYGVIPSAQYYFVNKPSWTFFGQMGYGFGFEDRTRGSVQNSALTVVEVGLGVAYHLSDIVYVRLLLPFLHAQNVTFDEEALTGVAPFLGFGFRM